METEVGQRTSLRRSIDRALDAAGGSLQIDALLDEVLQTTPGATRTAIDHCIGAGNRLQWVANRVAFATRRFDIDPALDPDMYVVIGGPFHGAWSWHPRPAARGLRVPPAFVHQLGLDPSSSSRSFRLLGLVEARFSADGSVSVDGLVERLGTDHGRLRLVVTREREVLVQGLGPVDESTPERVVSTHLDVLPGLFPPLRLVAAALGFGAPPSTATLLGSVRGRPEPFRRAVHRLLDGQV